MALARLARIVAGASLFASLALVALSYAFFHAALSARLDRARSRQAEVIRPAAAARLEAALAEKRLALVGEKESQAVAAALRRTDAAQILESCRLAGVDAAILREAQKALAEDKPPGPEGDVAMLRAIRGLRLEASRLPAPARPEEPGEARTAGGLLLAAGFCACLAVLLAVASSRKPA